MTTPCRWGLDEVDKLVEINNYEDEDTDDTGIGDIGYP